METFDLHEISLEPPFSAKRPLKDLNDIFRKSLETVSIPSLGVDKAREGLLAHSAARCTVSWDFFVMNLAFSRKQGKFQVLGTSGLSHVPLIWSNAFEMVHVPSLNPNPCAFNRGLFAKGFLVRMEAASCKIARNCTFGRAPKYRTKGCSRYWRPKFAARKWLKCCKNQCSRSRAVSGWVWTPFCVIHT